MSSRECRFKGGIVKLDTIENIGGPSVWLVKNEHGYVMPSMITLRPKLGMR